MLKSLFAEVKKLKRKRSGLVFFGLILIELLWLGWYLADVDSAVMEVGYLACLYQMPMLNALLLPVGIGVLVSNLCDIEHRGSTLKSIFTMQAPRHLYWCKLFVAFVHVVVCIAVQVVTIYFYGQVFSFADTFLLREYGLYFISQTACTMFLVVLMQWIALKTANQFIPLLCGIVTGFAGFMSAFFSPFLMRLIPSGYYMLLSTSSMEWFPESRLVLYSYKVFSTGDFLVLVGAMMIIILVGQYQFVRKEV